MKMGKWRTNKVNGITMKLPKCFRLPTPMELGKSKYNALPLKGFMSPSQKGEYTWDDWHRDMKKQYPIKYFITEDVFDWFDSKRRRINDAIYWLKSHTIRKYHLLDLRQPKTTSYCDSYRYGWIDSDRQMLLALFNILVNFCEKEKNVSEYIQFLKEEQNNNTDNIPLYDYSEQIKMFEEILDLYKYWKVDRPEKQKYLGDLLHRWSESRKEDEDNSWVDRGSQELFDEHTKLEKELLEEEECNMIRLIKVRGIMWT
jgi:hypothetical protein